MDDYTIAPDDIARAINDLMARHGCMPPAVDVVGSGNKGQAEMQVYSAVVPASAGTTIICGFEKWN